MDDRAEEEVSFAEAKPLRIRFPAVEWNNTSYDNLLLREPRVADIARAEAAAPEGHIAQLETLIQAVSKLPPPVIKLLPQRVMVRASEFFEGFSRPSPNPGGTSSGTSPGISGGDQGQRSA